MTQPRQLEWVKPPRQVRSQETLDRILEAAEELLLAKPFEMMSVTEIARRARSSVGALYARFADKEALLRCVLERFYVQAVATAEAALAPARWEGASATEVLETSMRFLIRTFRERRHLIAAMSLRAADEPALAAMGERFGELVADRVQALLEHRGAPIGHPDPAVALRLCVWLIMSAFEARAVFAPRADIGDSVLASEVTAMCLSYLSLDERASSAAAGERLVG